MKDLIPGGKSDKIPPSSFPSKKVREGAKVESEHTSNPQMAREIARDHLSEDMGYYGKLKKMEKKAFNEAAASKVLSIAKSRQLPKPAGRAFSFLAPSNPEAKKQMIGSMSAMPNRVSASEIATRNRTLEGMSSAFGMDRNSPELKGAFEEMARANNLARKIPGKIIPGPIPFRGMANAGAEMELSRPLSSQRFSPGNHKMLHAVVKGHELDEARAKLNLATQKYGHRSPEVLLKEHNRLMTMPSGHENVRDLFHAARWQERVGMGMTMPEQFQYGQSPRVSRHARKHLSNIMGRNAEQMGKDPMLALAKVEDLMDKMHVKTAVSLARAETIARKLPPESIQNHAVKAWKKLRDLDYAGKSSARLSAHAERLHELAGGLHLKKTAEWAQATLQMPERSFEPRVPNQDPWNRKSKTKKADAFFDELTKISFEVSGKGALIGAGIGAGVGGVGAIRHELQERSWDNRVQLSDEEKKALRKARRKGHLGRMLLSTGTGAAIGGSYKALGDAAAAVAKNVRHKIQPEINQAVTDTASQIKSHAGEVGNIAGTAAGTAAADAAASGAKKHFKMPGVKDVKDFILRKK